MSHIIKIFLKKQDRVFILRASTKHKQIPFPSCVIGWTALHEASVGGFYQTASELLKGGADVNIKGMYQITPLHDAVINGHYKVL